ncbi:MAG: ABC transporter substrate-binding protein [Sulfobacillus acidophilus]|uniref:ABC transporter substrate-binding protein n=1 Tax=Sulfobacillus acidophilus TaxID=53633 RepID=A0A2T2WFT1_9FIRM|nr:MAG: ABC transporter substrate-binding protein [Sulfobacillus acidophilus]
MKTRQWLAVVGVGALTTLTVAGWGTSPLAKTSSATASGKIIVMALEPLVAPNWFFPVFSSTAYTVTNLQATALMYKPLLDITKTDAIDYNRSLVSKIQVNKADTEFTLTMNSKYHWSNGKPVSAQDVVFNWDIIKATSQPGAPWGYGGAGIGGVPGDWKSVVALNPHTVVITTTKPVNPVWFIHNGIGQLEPVPASVWDKYPKNMARELRFIESVANSPTNPVYRIVDGPYNFYKYEADNYWEWAPNPHYGGKRSTISRFMLKYETSTVSEFAQLRAGTINVGYLSNSLWTSRQELPNDTLDVSYLFGFSSFYLNQNPKAPGGLGPVFAQQYVREALQMGVNQPGIIRGIYHGNGVVSYGPVSSKPDSIFYDPALSKPAYPYNPAKGKRLLESHGWHEVNGVMTRGKVQLKFTVDYISGSQSTTDMMSYIQAGWAKEGIKVTLQAEPLDTVVALGNQSDPTKWNMAGPMDWTYEPDYYPSGGGLFATGAGSNGGGYSSSQANAIIAKIYQPGTSQQTLKNLFAYEEYIHQSNPVLFMPWLAGSYQAIGFLLVHANNVHGTYQTFNPISDLLYPNYWTVQ